MKWGRRNGPPYPLKDGAHSAAEQKANPSLARRAANAAKSVANKANALVKGNGHYRYGKNPRRLSDEELAARIKRLQQEALYEQLMGKKTRAQRLEERVIRGKKFSENLGLSIGANLGRRIGNFGQGVGDIARSAAGIVAKDVASVPGTLIKDVASIPGHLIGLGQTAATQAISNHKDKQQRYDAKLASAKSKKAYEDWMFDNDKAYAKRILDSEREAAKKLQAIEQRRIAKAEREAEKALDRIEQRKIRKEAEAELKAEIAEAEKASKEYWKRLSEPIPTKHHPTWERNRFTEQQDAQIIKRQQEAFRQWQNGQTFGNAILNLPDPGIQFWNGFIDG